MQKQRLRLLLVLLVCGVLALPAVSQTTTGTISGTVVDASGAVIADASVSAENVAQKSLATTKTGSDGKFMFVQMLPSTYTITIEKNGFRRFNEKNVVLNANTNISVGNVTLQVGGTEQVVEVLAEGDQLQSESAERSTSIIGTQIANTQINGRGYLALLRVVPGMVSDLDTQATSNQTGNMQMNGARGTTANVTLNGASNIDTGSNTKMFATISPDAVQEFTVLGAAYQAQYGKASGAQINVVSKSGTTDFHGTGYEYYRDQGLNSNDWMRKRDGKAILPYHYNVFGYNIGGPAYIPGFFNKDKKKLFFFWSDEYQRQLIPQTSPVRIMTPTEAERNGDFSNFHDQNGVLKNLIKDPLSPNACTAADTSGCFQDGGVLGKIPANRLYAPGLAALKFLPLPNVTGKNGYNYETQNSYSNPRHEQLLRMDYNINDKWRLNGSWVNLAQDIVSADYCPSGYSLCSNYPVTPWIYNHPGYILAVNLATNISNTWTNEFMADIGHHPVQVLPTDESVITRKTTGINLPTLYTPYRDWIPNMTYNGGPITNTPNLDTGGGAWVPYNGYNTTFELADNISKMLGKHFVKFGAFVQRSRKNQPAYAWVAGNYSFGAGGANGTSNPYDTGNGFANAAIGSFQQLQENSKYILGKYRYTNFEMYVQDTFHLSSRLTLDAGVRAYYIQPQYDQGGSVSTFLPSLWSASDAPHIYKPAKDSSGNKILVDSKTGQPMNCTPYALCLGKLIPGTGTLTNGIAQAGEKGLNSYLLKVPPILFAPRLGLAFDVTGRGNMVLRMGAGVFYDRYQGNEVINMINNPPANTQVTVYNGNLNPANGPVTVDPNSAFMTPPDLTVTDYRGKIPTVYNWTTGLQAKLPMAMMLDIAYVGSTARQLMYNYNLNAAPFGAAFLPQNQDPTKSSSLPGGTAYDSNYLRPYQGLGNITMQTFGATSNYNALQVQLSRRFKSGLFLTAAYTWSKCLDVADYDGSATPVSDLGPAYIKQYNYGPCNYDVPQNLTVNYVYTLPKFSKLVGSNNGLLTRIMDGWTVSGISIFRNGTPATVNQSVGGGASVTTFTGTGGQIGTLRPVLVGDPLAGTSSDPYNRINPAAFAMQPSPTLGLGSMRNMIYQPGVNNWDMTIQKTVPINEKARLELRLEAFNAFNHTQFNTLNTTVNFNSYTDPRVANNPYKLADGTARTSVNTSGFGTVSSVRSPRIVQLVGKFVF